MEGARVGCSASEGRRGKAAVYAAKGPCARVCAATVRTDGGRRSWDDAALPTRDAAARGSARPFRRALGARKSEDGESASARVWDDMRPHGTPRNVWKNHGLDMPKPDAFNSGYPQPKGIACRQPVDH
jgi:hypothetical protein